ncbi:hypothetical protein SNE40_004104 [Patella caerulea]|uniref:Uncharacterized protein n=1 Tax=Patella caerulea TaxID=87958 RepID=A0AAN8KJR6_PATCE
MKAFVVLVVFSAVALSETNAGDLECATAHVTCASYLADAANSDCTKKEPYFKCLRDSGCSTDDAPYKASAVTLDYSKCTNSNNGVAALAITWMFTLVMIVMSKTFCD